MNFKEREELQQFTLPDLVKTGRNLGNGSFGTVLEFHGGGVYYAGKKLNHNPSEQSIPYERFVSECKLMSELHHPNIVQFIGLTFCDDSPYPILVMERLECSLDGFLQKRADQKLDLSIKLRILSGVLKGLVYLHSRNIVHRDLTARNVLLTNGNQAKITDLGNALIVDPRTLTNTLSQMPGAFMYMPPEALCHKPSYNSSLDMFSFGHLALYTITQVFPDNLQQATYPHPETGALLARSEVERRQEYIDILHDQHGDTFQAVENCLSNRPESRPTADEMMQIIEDILERQEDAFAVLGEASKVDLVGLVEVLKKKEKSKIDLLKTEMEHEFEESIKNRARAIFARKRAEELQNGQPGVLDIYTNQLGRLSVRQRFKPRGFTWKERVFKISESGHLQCCKGNRVYNKLLMSTVTDVIATSSGQQEDPSKFYFEINFNGKLSPWILRASSWDDRTAWMEAIKPGSVISRTSVKEEDLVDELVHEAYLRIAIQESRRQDQRKLSQHQAQVEKESDEEVHWNNHEEIQSGITDEDLIPTCNTSSPDIAEDDMLYEPCDPLQPADYEYSYDAVLQESMKTVKSIVPVKSDKDLGDLPMLPKEYRKVNSSPLLSKTIEPLSTDSGDHMYEDPDLHQFTNITSQPPQVKALPGPIPLPRRRSSTLPQSHIKRHVHHSPRKSVQEEDLYDTIDELTFMQITSDKSKQPKQMKMSQQYSLVGKESDEEVHNETLEDNGKHDTIYATCGGPLQPSEYEDIDEPLPQHTQKPTINGLPLPMKSTSPIDSDTYEFLPMDLQELYCDIVDYSPKDDEYECPDSQQLTTNISHPRVKTRPIPLPRRRTLSQSHEGQSVHQRPRNNSVTETRSMTSSESYIDFANSSFPTPLPGFKFPLTHEQQYQLVIIAGMLQQTLGNTAVQHPDTHTTLPVPSPRHIPVADQQKCIVPNSVECSSESDYTHHSPDYENLPKTTKSGSMCVSPTSVEPSLQKGQSHMKNYPVPTPRKFKTSRTPHKKPSNSQGSDNAPALIKVEQSDSPKEHVTEQSKTSETLKAHHAPTNLKTLSPQGNLDIILDHIVTHSELSSVHERLVVEDDLQSMADRPKWAKATATTDSMLLKSGEDTLEELQQEALFIPPSAIQDKIPIGKGKFGQVYKAKLCKGSGPGITVAVKTVKTLTERENNHFQKEVRRMQQMVHPNIVRMYGLVQQDPAPWMVMEYFEHGDLKNFLTVQYRPVETLVKYMLDVAVGMHYITERGLVHRDLAARNVIVGENEICKVSDFGLLREIPKDQDIFTSMTVGGLFPIRWMAPESLTRREFSSASDVWSYGVLLWEMANPKKSPYSGITGSVIHQRVVDGSLRLEIPSEYPSTVQKIMKACWHEPDKRPSFLLISSLLTRLTFGAK